MTDLCTLADVKLARPGLPTTLDETISAFITRASAAVIRYAGRQFIADVSPSDRLYDTPSGTDLLIDDLTAPPSAIALVDGLGSTVASYTMGTDYVTGAASDAAPITRVRFASRFWPVFGQKIKVTGTWGWPSVPGDVAEAAITTVIEWLKDGQGLTPQSPNPFEPGVPPQRGLPVKARDLIRPYRRPVIA